MKTSITTALLFSMLAACGGAVTPAADVDGGHEDASALVSDGDTVDAFVSDVVDGGDAAFLDAMIDAFSTDDAAVEPDAFVAPDVSLEEACNRARVAYVGTPCNEEFFHCAFTSSSVPEVSVAACEASIIDARSSGGSETTRCIAAGDAVSRCTE